jgi:hypothetical protein
MRRHELDPVSLVFGFAFSSAGLLFLAGRLDQAVRLRWLWPVLLLALGLAILLDLNVRRPKPATEPAAVEEAEPPAGGRAEAETVEADRAEPVEAGRAEPEPVAAGEAGAEPVGDSEAHTAEPEPEDPPYRDR